LDEWRRGRFIAEGDAPWLTIAKATAELESLRAEEGAVHPDLPNEIENHLSEHALEARRYCD
jgi:hypothetical protein